MAPKHGEMEWNEGAMAEIERMAMAAASKQITEAWQAMDTKLRAKFRDEGEQAFTASFEKQIKKLPFKLKRKAKESYRQAVLANAPFELEIVPG